MNPNNIIPSISSKNQKILSIYFPPPIYYSLYAAVRFSILLANPKTHDWFYCNFIQLHFEDLDVNPVVSDHHLNIFPVEYMKSYEYCGASFFLQETFIDEKIMPIDKGTLIPRIIGWIDEGFYIISRTDVSKLPGTRYYKNKPMVHTVFFYGYDLQKRIFKYLDFNKNGDFVMLDIKFDDYRAAFFSSNLPELYKEKQINSHYYILLCRVKPQQNLQFQLDPESIKTLLNDYLYSNNTSRKFNLFVPEASGVYGMSIYEAMIDFVDLTVRTYQEIDFRLFHALYEHKKIMVERLKYLEDLKIIDCNRKLPERFHEIVEMADRARYFVLRYLITKNNQMVIKTNYLLKNISELEKPLIEEIIACL